MLGKFWKKLLKRKGLTDEKTKHDTIEYNNTSPSKEKHITRSKKCKKVIDCFFAFFIFCTVLFGGTVNNATTVQAANFPSKVVNIGGYITLQGSYSVSVWRNGNTVYCKVHVDVSAPNGAYQSMGASMSTNHGSASNTFVGDGSSTPKRGSGDIQFSFNDAGAGTISGTVYAGFTRYLNSTYALTASINASYAANSYAQTIQARYQNSDGSWGGYSTVKSGNATVNSTYSWSRPADSTYKAASISYKVTQANTKYVDVYRQVYNLKITGDSGVESISGNGSYYAGSTAKSTYIIKPGYQIKNIVGTGPDAGQTWTGSAGITGTVYDTWGMTRNREATINTEKIPQTIKINPNGGLWNGTTNVSTLSKGQGTSFTIKHPTRSGYEFAGWNTSQSTTGQRYAEGYTSIMTSTSCNANKTAYTGGGFTNYQWSNFNAQSNAWNYISFNRYSVSAGDTVKITGKIKVNNNSAGINLNFYHGATHNDYNNNMFVVNNTNGEWKDFEIERTFSSASNDCMLQIYTSNLNGITGTINFSLKNIKILNVTKKTMISDSDVVNVDSSSISMTALWKPSLHSVTYDANGGTMTGNTKSFKREGKPLNYTKQYETFTSASDVIELGHWQENVQSLTLVSKVNFNSIEGIQEYFNNFENGGWGLGIKNSGIPYMEIYDNKTSSYQIALGNYALKPDVDYWIIGEYDNAAKQIKLYVNGDLVGTKSIDASISNSQMPMILGANPDANSVYECASNMKLYKAAMYKNTALTQTQIETMIEADKKGENSLTSVGVTPAIRIDYQVNTPTRTGYKFLGWNTRADGNGTQVDDSTIVKDAMTLYAQWKPDTYTVQFDANGGSLPGNNILHKRYGKELNYTQNFQNFVSSEDNLYLGHANENLGGTVTIAAKIKLNVNNKYQEFFNNFEDGGLGFYLTSDGKLGFSARDSVKGYVRVESQEVLDTTNTHWVVGTYNALEQTISLYVDGNLKGQ